MNQRFLQTEFWAQFKSRHGWKAMYFVRKDGALLPVEKYDDACEDGRLTVLVRSFSIKIKRLSIAYVPMAPETDGENPDSLYKEMEEISSMLKKYLPENTICIKFDPACDFNNTEKCSEYVKNFRQFEKKNRHLNKKSIKILHDDIAVQPPDTVLLSLLPSCDDILSSMKSKWRYNIRLSEKKGVSVKMYTASTEGFSEAFDEFFRLFQITSERDAVQFHSKDYYLDLLENGDRKDVSVRLYMATHENDSLAGIITLFCGREAVYLYGASGNVKRNLMPAYLLQWNAIKDAKDFGCPVYDFYGCPPTDDEKHPMHGLFLFKTGFGGDLVHRPGSFNAVLRSGDYRLYETAEKARAWFFRVLKKKLAGR